MCKTLNDYCEEYRDKDKFFRLCIIYRDEELLTLKSMGMVIGKKQGEYFEQDIKTERLLRVNERVGGTWLWIELEGFWDKIE